MILHSAERAADWRAIEARMNPWLSADPDAEAVLDVFRANGDIYKKEAAGIYRCEVGDVTDDQRFIGKVASLACGYGGGVGVALQKGLHRDCPKAELPDIGQKMATGLVLQLLK